MQSAAKGYETGMKVTYEPRSRTVIISFRGRLMVLPGRYATEGEGVSAGESYCRLQGWRPAISKAFRAAW